MKWWCGIINVFIATNTGWRHYSRTVEKIAWLQREGHLSTRPFSRAKLYLFLMLLTQFCRPISERMAPKFYTGEPGPPKPYLLMAVTHVPERCHCPPPKKLLKAIQLCPLTSPLACFMASSAWLSSMPELCLGCPFPPLGHWHRLGKMAPKDIHLCFSTSWGNLSVGYFRSAKIIPATLGKSPGCEIFRLKMENWGQYSYSNFLNSKSLKIKKYICVYSVKGLGSSWAAWLRGWIKTEQLCWS